MRVCNTQMRLVSSSLSQYNVYWVACDKHLFHHISYTENRVKVLEDWNERMRYVNNRLNIHERTHICASHPKHRWNVEMSVFLLDCIKVARRWKPTFDFTVNIDEFIRFIWLSHCVCICKPFHWHFAISVWFANFFSSFFRVFLCPDDGSDLHVVNYKMNSRTNYTHAKCVTSGQSLIFFMNTVRLSVRWKSVFVWY